MKPIATPAWRLTADCILTSFRQSGKRHLLLTGTRGSGKSTLLARLSPALNLSDGVTTWAQPQKAVYLRENATGQTVQVGAFDASLPGTENKMRLLPGGFETRGVQALARCEESAAEWISVDEIGYLEAQCAAYRDAIVSLMQKKRVAAVVRKQNLPFLCALLAREDVFVIDLDAPFARPGCVIMASGLGRRFGGNKLMADFGGAPLIARALEATEGIFAERVVVTRHRDVAAFCQSQGVRVCLHDRPARSDTVRLGLDALPESISGCLFCPGDQPLLQKDTVAALALCAANAPDFIWRTAFEGMPGSPVLFPRWAFDALRALPEGKGGGVIAKKHPEQVRFVPVRDADELSDVDTPQDLTRLLLSDSFNSFNQSER